MLRPCPSRCCHGRQQLCSVVRRRLLSLRRRRPLLAPAVSWTGLPLLSDRRVPAGLPSLTRSTPRLYTRARVLRLLGVDDYLATASVVRRRIRPRLVPPKLTGAKVVGAVVLGLSVSMTHHIRSVDDIDAANPTATLLVFQLHRMKPDLEMILRIGFASSILYLLQIGFVRPGAVGPRTPCRPLTSSQPRQDLHPLLLLPLHVGIEDAMDPLRDRVLYRSVLRCHVVGGSTRRALDASWHGTEAAQVNLFGCQPISLNWEVIRPHECAVDPFDLQIAPSVSNLVTDVLILVTPIPMMLTLNASPRKKGEGPSRPRPPRPPA